MNPVGRHCSGCNCPLPENYGAELCPKCKANAKGENAAGDDSSEAESIPKIKVGEFIKYFGDYEVLEKISEGGMGIVFKARQKSLDRIVAVKTIRSGQFADDNEIRHFVAEAQLAAQLQHENIVRVHEIGEHDGYQYFSMDYIQGPSLKDKLKVSSSPLGIAESLKWIQEIAQGVAYAHKFGIVHRDLKPGNILIESASGRAKVADFGLAHRISAGRNISSPGAGTDLYMAPEQVNKRGDLIAPHTDVYGLGAILYQMLTGCPPFSREGHGLFRAILEEEPTDPSKLNRLVPSVLAAICLKCLQKKPNLRYASALDLLSDLRHFTNGETTVAQPPSLPQHIWRWLRSHRAAATPLLTIIFLSLSWGIYGLFIQNSHLRWELNHPSIPPRLSVAAEIFGNLLTKPIWWIAFAATPAVFFKILRRPQLRRFLSGERLGTDAFLQAGTFAIIMAAFYLLAGALAVEIQVSQNDRPVEESGTTPPPPVETETNERLNRALGLGDKLGSLYMSNSPATPAEEEAEVQRAIAIAQEFIALQDTNSNTTPERVSPEQALELLTHPQAVSDAILALRQKLPKTKPKPPRVANPPITAFCILISAANLLFLATVFVPATAEEISPVIFPSLEDEKKALEEARAELKDRPRALSGCLVTAMMIVALLLILFLAIRFVH